MGLFVKNHGNYDESAIRVSGTNRKNDYVAYGINSGLSIFGSLFSSLDEGRGGVDNDKDDENPKVSKKTQAEIDELTKSMNAVLKSVNVSSVDDLKSAISTSEQAQKTSSKQIEETKLSINVFQTVIDEYPSKRQDLLKQLDSADAQAKPLIQSQIDQLETDKKNAENDLENLNKELKSQEDKLKSEQLKFAELNTKLAEVENYQHRIDTLEKKELPKEVTYDVKKETGDLSNFSSALAKFKANPSQETASELYSAYRGNGNGVDNPTAKKAYEFVEKQYPQFFTKFKTV